MRRLDFVMKHVPHMQATDNPITSHLLYNDSYSRHMTPEPDQLQTITPRIWPDVTSTIREEKCLVWERRGHSHALQTQTPSSSSPLPLCDILIVHQQSSSLRCSFLLLLLYLRTFIPYALLSCVCWFMCVCFKPFPEHEYNCLFNIYVYIPDSE